MIRFQADADLQQNIVRAVRRREPSINFATAAEGEIAGLPDSGVLEMAAREGRILVTHDLRTMPDHFRARLTEGRDCPGVLIVSQFEPIGPVVEALLLIWAASDPSDWRNQIRHLPSLAAHVFGRRGAASPLI